MRIAINAASAHMGGALTYLRNVLPVLSARAAASGGSVVLWAPAAALGDDIPLGVSSRDPGLGTGGAKAMLRRILFDQWQLPRGLAADRASALFSSANFGTLRSPIRQVLLVRNSLYFDPVALGRIRSGRIRARYAAQRALTLQSVRAADAVLYPSQAMMDIVSEHLGQRPATWHVAPYGTRHDAFFPAADDVRAKSHVTLLHVSLYCDQKNLGTLLRALRQLGTRGELQYRLRLTAGFRAVQAAPWHPNLESEREEFFRLEAAGLVQDLDRQSYRSLPDLYRGADIFVFPSYTESFGHPLVEAMASGLPIVAADVPINREMCGDAAIYFPAFDVTACTAAIAAVAEDADLRRRLRDQALTRARLFTWERHVDALWSALSGNGS